MFVLSILSSVGVMDGLHRIQMTFRHVFPSDALRDVHPSVCFTGKMHVRARGTQLQGTLAKWYNVCMYKSILYQSAAADSDGSCVYRLGI